MPTNFTGHYKADGIAISIDGNNWTKIYDLAGSSSISLDLNLVSLFGSSADLSDVRIKLQQYDNYPSPTDDGREFDNIQVSVNAAFDLNTWTENLMADDVAGGGFVINSTTSAETISGGLTRAVLFSGMNDIGYMLEGQLRVTTTFDDDFIGFVVGYNNNDHISGSADYILIDWKQADNDVDFGAGTVTGHEGLALSTVSGATAGEIQGNTYAWAHSGPITEQLRANTLGSTGWNDEQTYDFKLVYLPGSVQLFIDGTLELNYNGTFSDGSIGLYQFSQREVVFSNLSLSPIQTVPYSQDFSSGLPDASEGWEYYSNNNGRIQIVGGRLRMDDSVGDGAYSLNEAILHLNLVGQTNVNLSLDHYSIYDENHTLPANFTGHANGDGIAVSINGINWIKVSDLTGSSHISLDLDLVGLFGASTDLSDVRIKFQQYDNYPSPTDDGREFDNIQVTAILSGITIQTIPYSQDFSSTLPDASNGWEYYSDNDGRIQIVGGRLRMDDSVGDGTYSLNEAILHVDLTGQTNVNLSLDHHSIYDENHNTMPANFTGHYKADGIAISIDGLNWTKIYDLAGSSSISLDLNLVSLFGGSADLSDVRIKFQQYDNYPSTTSDDGREFDNIQITTISSGIVVQSAPYSQDFSSTLPDASGGWEYYSENDGRIQIVGGRLRMDDSVGDGTYSLNEAILHVNLTGQTNVNLSLDHYSIDDENHTMPTSFTGHYKADGIAVSIDGFNWIKISALSGSSAISIDTDLVSLFGGSADLSDVRIKFQQYDNYPSPTDDGREFDNIQITPISSSIVVQSTPYSQDFESGLPDASDGWEYYSDNDGRIQIVGGRLRMDDSVGDSTYSLNEAILHVDLTGHINVNLSFDHYSIFDENHNTMPASFTGHYKADGVAISIDGLNWIRISYLASSSAVSIDLDLVSLFGGSADLSNVRIKFQQYDNYPSPADDGREFDNIQIVENQVYFADPNLKAAVEARLGVSDPTPSEMLDMTSLDADNKGIFDLTGLEYAKNLTELWLRYNQIGDISPLSSLTNLTFLHLQSNQISDISPVSSLINLTDLVLSENQIIDIYPVSGLTNLTFLGLKVNQVSNISPVSGLTNLTTLSLFDNQISDISVISGLNKLSTLYLSNNQVSDISTLSGLINLKSLQIDDNPISDFTVISGLTKLESLSLSSNQINDISFLSGLTNLIRLHLSNNLISDLNPLSGLVNLRYLYLDNNSISDISSLSGHIFLKLLYLSDNQISDINPIAGSIYIENLHLENNLISNISSLSGLTELHKLFLNNNQISDISPLSVHEDLDELDLRVNTLNSEAYSIYIPLIQVNNPGITLLYDPA
jgi:internalin A